MDSATDPLDAAVRALNSVMLCGCPGLPRNKGQIKSATPSGTSPSDFATNPPPVRMIRASIEEPVRGKVHSLVSWAHTLSKGPISTDSQKITRDHFKIKTQL